MTDLPVAAAAARTTQHRDSTKPFRRDYALTLRASGAVKLELDSCERSAGERNTALYSEGSVNWTILSSKAASLTGPTWPPENAD